MDFAFLGSPADMVLVVVVALVVFGPKRLPEVARQVGSFVREARSMLSHVTESFEGMGHEAHSAGSTPSDNVMKPRQPGVSVSPATVPYDQREAYKQGVLHHSESPVAAEPAGDSTPSLRLTSVSTPDGDQVQHRGAPAGEDNPPVGLRRDGGELSAHPQEAKQI